MYGLPFEGESTASSTAPTCSRRPASTHPPTTWDEMRPTPRSSPTRKKQYGIELFATESAYYWYPFLYQAGGDLLTTDGKTSLQQHRGQEGGGLLRGPRQVRPAGLPQLQLLRRAHRLRRRARSACTWPATGSPASLQDEPGDRPGSGRRAPLPEAPPAARRPSPATPRPLHRPKNNDAAWKWIEYLSKPENIARGPTRDPGVKGVKRHPAPAAESLSSKDPRCTRRSRCSRASPT